MNFEIKSLEKYIEQCISEFTYFDFAPPIDHPSLALRFAEIFHKKNAYWEMPILEDKWPRWVFITFKMFSSGRSPILGMCFNRNMIVLTLTSSLSSTELEDEKKQTGLEIFDVWLDHKKLYNALVTLIKSAIGQANTTN